MLGLFGCGKRYKVDFDGTKDFFKGAKESYRAGEKVRLCYNMIATDTNYYFYLDDEPITPGYNDSDGFIITFIMPAHDVKLTVAQRNTMIAPDTETGDYLDFQKLVYDSFDGGGPSYKADNYNPRIISVDQKREYANPDHEQMDGSPYNIVFIIRGLEPGETKLTITSRSPIDGYEETEDHTVTVDESLRVKLD